MAQGSENHGVTRILIVDDNEYVRRYLKTFLQNADPRFSVCGEAGDGKEALLKADELKPDVVILDLAMPVMDGVTAAREISKTHQGVVIFMYTLHSTYQLELEARKAGIRKIVAKSAATELVSLIREIAIAHNNDS
jgi:DNA-binding NarL/FixJ family response regulator